MVKYVFWKDSIPGLEHRTVVLAHTYEEALHKIMHDMYLNRIARVEGNETFERGTAVNGDLL